MTPRQPLTARALAASFVALALAATPNSALTQETTSGKRPMTFADLMAMKRVSDPQVSPSGKWVLFSVTDVSLEKNSRTNHLWVVPIDGSAKERQLTASDTGESNGRFSPDGKWISYTATASDGKQQIFIARWDDTHGQVDIAAPYGAKARPITALETEADGAIWAPDSQHILFTSGVYPECESHLPPGPNHNAEEVKCNSDKDAAEAKNPVKARIFTELLYRHWNQFTGPKHSHIFYAALPAHLDTEQEPAPVAPTDLTPATVIGDHEAPTFSLGGPLGYAISPDGKEIAYEVNLDKVPAESTNNDIYILQLGAAPSTAKKVSTSPGSDDGPQYSPDGKWLAWRSQARGGFESDRFWLIIYDRAASSARKLDLDLKDYSRPGKPAEADFDRSIDEFAWSADSSRLFFVCADRGEAIIYGTNNTGDDLHRFGKVPGEWGSLAEVPAGAAAHPGEWVATYMTANSPTELVVADPYKMDDSAVTVSNLPISTPRGKGLPLVHDSSVPDLDFLTRLNQPLLAQLSRSPQESFTFPGANNTKVQGFLIRPPNFGPHKKYPLKFLIHGGPQGAWGDAWSYRWNPELFAANGYVVVMINPRGSTGYGQQFVDEVSGDWGGRPYEDLMKGLDYAEQHFAFIDKTRECALGASYGGFMANWVLTHTDRFKCIVTHDGMYNPQSAFGTTEELWFNEWEFRPLRPLKNPGAPPSPAASSRAKVGSQNATGDATVEQTTPAHPWDFYDKPASEDPFRKWSPMLNIKNAHTPTLVIHGQRDYRLDVSEGFQLFTALQLLNVPSKMLYFPDEGHWVLKPQNSELWYKTVNDWCDRWTGTNAYATLGPEKNPKAQPQPQPQPKSDQ